MCSCSIVSYCAVSHTRTIYNTSVKLQLYLCNAALLRFLPSCAPSIVINQFLPPSHGRPDAVAVVMTLETRWLLSAVSALHVYGNKCSISHWDLSWENAYVLVCWYYALQAGEKHLLNRRTNRKPCLKKRRCGWSPVSGHSILLTQICWLLCLSHCLRIKMDDVRAAQTWNQNISISPWWWAAV